MEESSEQKTSGYGKRPMWQWIAIYLVIAVILYGAFYYFVLAKKGGNNSSQSNPYQTQQNTTPTSTTPQESSSSANVQKITVEGNEYAFTPSTITAKSGQPLEITFKNTGKFPHNLTIADLNVQTKTIQSGEQDVIQFTPSKAGQFSFACTVPGHADKGMKGTLTVQ